jgi:hypothetical protein
MKASRAWARSDYGNGDAGDGRAGDSAAAAVRRFSRRAGVIRPFVVAPAGNGATDDEEGRGTRLVPAHICPVAGFGPCRAVRTPGRCPRRLRGPPCEPRAASA